MPSDASIYGLIRQPEPVDAIGKALQLKALMGQSRLQELQTTKAERDLDEEQQVRDVFARAAPGAALETLLPDVYRASPKVGVEMQGKVLTQKKTQADLDKTLLETQAKAAELHRDQLANVTDPQSAAAWVQAGFADPAIGPILKRGGSLEQALARIPQDPTQFQDWKARNGMGIQKFLEMQNANAQHAETRKLTEAGQAETARHHGATERQVAAAAAETGRHHAAIEGDPTTIETTAQAIAKGDLPPLTGFALARPMGQQIMSRVTAINPEYNPTAFVTRQKTENEFATGKSAQAVKSFNVGLSHLGTLEQLADALNNGNVQVVNRVANAYATQTGGAAPVKFDAAKQIVGDEIVKAIVGAGGGVADREKAQKTVDAVNTPAQLKGVIATYKELMRGQLNGLKQQYTAGGGRKDFDKDFLSAEARAVAHGPEAGKSKVVKWGDL